VLIEKTTKNELLKKIISETKYSTLITTLAMMQIKILLLLKYKMNHKLLRLKNVSKRSLLIILLKV